MLLAFRTFAVKQGQFTELLAVMCWIFSQIEDSIVSLSFGGSEKRLLTRKNYIIINIIAVVFVVFILSSKIFYHFYQYHWVILEINSIKNIL